MPKHKLDRSPLQDNPVLQEALDPSNSYLAKVPSKRDVVGSQIVVDGDIPRLPEYLREFALRFVTEPNRTNHDWANIFRVAPTTINSWLNRKDVLKYIMTVRYERRKLNMERMLSIENQALVSLQEILSAPLTNDNMKEKLDAAVKTLSLFKEGRIVAEEGDSKNRGANVTINNYNETHQNVLNMSDEELQERIEEYELVERAIEGDFDVVDDETGEPIPNADEENSSSRRKTKKRTAKS